MVYQLERARRAARKRNEATRVSEPLVKPPWVWEMRLGYRSAGLRGSSRLDFRRWLEEGRCPRCGELGKFVGLMPTCSTHGPYGEVVVQQPREQEPWLAQEGAAGWEPVEGGGLEPAEREYLQDRLAEAYKRRTDLFQDALRAQQKSTQRALASQIEKQVEHQPGWATPRWEGKFVPGMNVKVQPLPGDPDWSPEHQDFCRTRSALFCLRKFSKHLNAWHAIGCPLPLRERWLVPFC